jgi:hypothetical protein
MQLIYILQGFSNKFSTKKAYLVKTDGLLDIDNRFPPLLRLFHLIGVGGVSENAGDSDRKRFLK